MRKIPLPFFCMLLLCACTGPDHKNEKPGVERTVNSNTSVMKFTKHEVMDKEGTGEVASTYLLPEGWSANDQLYWEYGDATVPIRFKAKFQNADGSMMIQSYPDVRANWSSGPSGTSGYKPPSDIISGMKDLINQERKGVNINYVDQKILSNTPQSGSQQGSEYHSTSQSAVIKIAYNENNQDFEEEFYCQLDETDMITPSVMGNMEGVVWSANSMYSCKAVKGKLDDCRKIAQTIQASARLTKPFYNKLMQVIQLLSNQVYQQIYQAGQISKIISQTNDQMIANIDASYQQTQKTYDRINEQFSNYIRGVDNYSDGESQVQLPSGYDNAWVNDRGEYIITNTPGYDPAKDYDGNWRQLEKRGGEG